jgi:hypothetical protein
MTSRKPFPAGPGYTKVNIFTLADDDYDNYRSRFANPILAQNQRVLAVQGPASDAQLQGCFVIGAQSLVSSGKLLYITVIEVAHGIICLIKTQHILIKMQICRMYRSKILFQIKFYS